MNILKLKESKCSCDRCKAMCKRPCWPTPKEAKKLIDRGYAKRLMMDYWASEPNIYIICPALKGYEGMETPWWPSGERGCTFQDSKGLCEIHGKHLKPIEGRIAHHNEIGRGHGFNLHQTVAKLWDSKEGRDIVWLWKQKVWRNKNENE